MASTSTSREMSVSDLMLQIEEEIHVNAPIAMTFEALLEQLGPEQKAGPNQDPMPMKIEAWPGGRWYRDLGNNDGHLWGHVQAIKKPTLLEICGPLMVSSSVSNNVQYRLTEVQGGTMIKFHHIAMGIIPENFKIGVTTGWKMIHERIRKAAEAKRK
jgi:uncharacterized protein YndB with AHSA1/START domain